MKTLLPLLCLPVLGLIGVSETRAEVAKALTIQLDIPAPEDSGGGYFHDMGCHALDILFFIFGNPLKVSGTTSNVGGLYDPADTISATLLLPNKLVVTGSWSFVTPESYEKDILEVVGEKGKFSIFSFKPISLIIGEQKETIDAIQTEHIQMPFIETIVSELKGKGSCPSTGLTAAITSQVMDQITEC